MSESKIYEQLSQRTGGACMLGVVGPVRTGKSSFIQRFMEKLVIPRIENSYMRQRAWDELPQSGSGGSALGCAVAMGCDSYVTADVKHDVFLEAAELGVNLIDAGHFCTENPVIPALCARLREAFPAVDFRVSQRHTQTPHFF